MEARYKSTKKLNSTTALNTGIKYYSTLTIKEKARPQLSRDSAFNKPNRETVSSEYIKCTLLESYLHIRSQTIINLTLFQSREYCHESKKNLPIKNSHTPTEVANLYDYNSFIARHDSQLGSPLQIIWSASPHL